MEVTAQCLNLKKISLRGPVLWQNMKYPASNKRVLFKAGVSNPFSTQHWAILASGRGQGQLAVSMGGGCLAAVQREGF